MLAAVGIFAKDEPLSIAVFDFDSVYKVKRHLVTDLLTASLSAEPQLLIVDRETLSKSLGEQALGLSGNITPETAAKVGQQTGAKVLITGRLFKSGNDWSIIVRMIGTESGRVYTETGRGSEAELANMVTALSTKLSKTLLLESTNLVVKADSKDQRIDRIIKSASPGRRPSVLIRIVEQNSGGSKNNSTVETELGFILQKAGFTLVDDKSKDKPEIEITGESVSEAGTAKGDLVSARAVIEVKVLELSTGKILAIDRQKGTAVDIGRLTATRAALENAAEELAARLVPLLAR